MSEERTYVPDGDPCPKAGHDGQPTALLHLPGVGYLSQCLACIDDFFAWYGGPSQGGPAPRAPSALLDLPL